MIIEGNTKPAFVWVYKMLLEFCATPIHFSDGFRLSRILPHPKRDAAKMSNPISKGGKPLNH